MMRNGFITASVLLAFSLASCGDDEGSISDVLYNARLYPSFEVEFRL